MGWQKMNPEYKAAWVAALRSGKYQQTRGRLFDGQGYCCLGVLCRVAGAEFKRDSFTSIIPVYLPTKINGIEIAGNLTLNKEGRELFGIEKHEMSRLVDLNDGIREEKTNEVIEPPQNFSTIADWIEKDL